MAENEKKQKHLGADLDEAFVLKFRAFCLDNDFKQKTIVYRLAEWWLEQDPIAQEHNNYHILCSLFFLLIMPQLGLRPHLPCHAES